MTHMEAGQELILLRKQFEGIDLKVLAARLRKHIYSTTLEKDERPDRGTNEPRNIGGRVFTPEERLLVLDV